MAVREATEGNHKREPGGLGIFSMKTMMDEVHYRREKDPDILTLTIQKD
jgi:anti-sigma regulatory factor (Ser/Thr protein kinase)